MPNSNNTGSVSQQQDRSKNLLSRVKHLVTKPDSRNELEQLLDDEMKNVDSAFSALGISQDHIYHFPKFGEVIGCFEANLPILTQMMYVVGKSNSDKEINCISNFIKSKTQQVASDFQGIQRDVGNLRLLPLVSILSGYGLGLLSSQRLSTFQKLLETKTDSQKIDSSSRIVDYLLSHVWEGREIRLWKYYIPEGLMKPSASMPDAHNILLTRMAFLNYFDDKLSMWLSSELDSTNNFRNLMNNYKILGSLIYLERFKSNEIKVNLYNGGELDYTCFKFDHNVDFFDNEVSLIDKILTQDYINNLKKTGFKVSDSNYIKFFKQFYVEIHYLPQYWCDAYLNSEIFLEKVNGNQTVL